MTRLFNQQWTRKELTDYIGDLSQVAGIKLGEWSEGHERGLRVADVRNGSGLAYTVLLDRGMDIGPAAYKGMPLAWISAASFSHPMYYDPTGINWLRTFGGGLLTGCGLTSVGAPGVDDGESLGLHGRLSHLPVRHFTVSETWLEDECSLILEGEMRQARVFGENLSLKRRITTGVGENTIHVHDTVENLGKTPSPLMVLYHINLGFPLLDENSELVAMDHSVEPRDQTANAGIKDWMRFQKPTPDYEEQVFYHDIPSNKDGWAKMELRNQKRNLTLTVRYQKATLPNLAQWKMMGQGLYISGLEPANCHVTGRSQEKARGTLQTIDAGERREFDIEISIKELAE